MVNTILSRFWRLESGVKATSSRVAGGLDKTGGSSYYCFNKVIHCAEIDYGTSG